MKKFVYVIAMNFFRLMYYIPKMRWYINHPDKYSERDKYELFRTCIRHVEHTAFATPVSYGHENLPKDMPYVMFPNHQGKYDVLGIVSQNEEISSFVLSSKVRWRILVPEICGLVNAKYMVPESPSDALSVMAQVRIEIRNGRRYIIFPEGGYDNNGNTTQEFKPGTFKFAIRAKVPIVPVALIDSYKVFNNKIFEKVYPQIHFLKPLYYEEYKDMTTVQIAEIVKARIDECIEKNLQKKDAE